MFITFICKWFLYINSDTCTTLGEKEPRYVGANVFMCSSTVQRSPTQKLAGKCCVNIVRIDMLWGFSFAAA